MDTMALWRQVETTDPAYTKAYQGQGGFRGTAVNTTYLIRRATELFGPMGIRWGFDILDERLLPGIPLDEGVTEQVHVLRVRLWYHWSATGDDKELLRGEITQFGQTRFIGRNRFGLYTDEEAPKKSLTDAIGKCLSYLGFAADVHLGRYDDNRYVTEVTQHFAKIAAPAEEPPVQLMTDAQVEELAKLVTEARVWTQVQKRYGIRELDELAAEHYEPLRARLLAKIERDRAKADEQTA